MSELQVRKPFTADHIRAASNIPLVSRLEMRNLFELVRTSAHASVARLTVAPFRMSFDGLAEGVEVLPPPEGQHFACQTQHGPLEGWIVCDRGLVIALSDICFGGTGKEPAFDSADRPLSNIELRLRKTVLSDVMAQLPERLSEAFGFAMSPMPMAGAKGSVQEPQTAMALAGRLILTAFGYSGEMRLVFPRADLLKMFQAKFAAHMLQPSATVQSIAEQVRETAVDLQFVLPPQPIMLGALGGLQPGTMIHLAASAGDPVQVMSDGADLFRATLSFGGDSMAFTLLDSATGNPAAS